MRFLVVVFIYAICLNMMPKTVSAQGPVNFELIKKISIPGNGGGTARLPSYNRMDRINMLSCKQSLHNGEQKHMHMTR
jgi:hypothetical protein